MRGLVYKYCTLVALQAKELEELLIYKDNTPMLALQAKEVERLLQEQLF